MFNSNKSILPPVERTHYYIVLKELKDVLELNYLGSVLIDNKFRIVESHTVKKNNNEELSESVVAVLKRFKKFKGKSRIPLGGDLFPFKRLVLSLKDSYLTLLLSDHYAFALYLGKENLNIGTILNIICPKIDDLLLYLEKVKK